MSDNADRQTLARQQRELVSALAGGAAPPGIDDAGLAIAARSLSIKRRRGIEKTWPLVCEALGPRLAETFARYAAGNDPPAEGHWEDGRRFAEWLEKEGLLDDP